MSPERKKTHIYPVDLMLFLQLTWSFYMFIIYIQTMLEDRTNLALHGALCKCVVGGCHLSKELVVQKERAENGTESQQRLCHICRLTEQLGSHRQVLVDWPPWQFTGIYVKFLAECWFNHLHIEDQQPISREKLLQSLFPIPSLFQVVCVSHCLPEEGLALFCLYGYIA